MNDRNKRIQRNIRVPDDLWSFVQGQAKKGHTRTGDCSAVIRGWILDRMNQEQKKATA